MVLRSRFQEKSFDVKFQCGGCGEQYRCEARYDMCCGKSCSERYGKVDMSKCCKRKTFEERNVVRKF